MLQVLQNIGGITGLSGLLGLVWEPWIMLVLLAGSAFFSGSETAFFNLTRRQIRTLRHSGNKLEGLVTRLLDHPRDLLACILLGNTTVNVLFFAISSALIIRLERDIGAAAAATAAVVCLLILVIFGEILPKSIAYAVSRKTSIAASPLVFLCFEVLGPVARFLRFFIAEPVLLLLLGHRRTAGPISTVEFQGLIEQVSKSGLISAEENKLLGEVIELGFLKVRHVMRPRMDMISCSVKNRPQKACEIMQAHHMTKIPVFSGGKDNIIGTVELRDMLLWPKKSIEGLLGKVEFVPEQQKVESLLEFLRGSGTDTAIVVDEYGGIAGQVTLEDIAEELIGPIETPSGTAPIEQVGPFEYRLAGDLAIHDWASSFGIDVAQSRFTTIGGLVTALLGRIAKPGDVAQLNNLKFTVERMRKHRIDTLILTLEPIKKDD